MFTMNYDLDTEYRRRQEARAQRASRNRMVLCTQESTMQRVAKSAKRMSQMMLTTLINR